MPAEAPAFGTAALSRQRRIGLRVALAVAVGFTFDVATGAVLPFLGALFAVQFLVFGARPLPLAKALGLIGFVLVVGQVFLFLIGIFGDRPFQLLALLGLFYFVCFYFQAQGRGGPAVFLGLVVAITVSLLDQVHASLDSSVIAILLQGCVGGVLLSWLAHLAVPSGHAVEEEVQPVPAVPRPALRAVANAVILLGAVTICLTNDRFSLALVMPITVASLLLQFDLTTNLRSVAGLVLVNLLGGVLASLAFAFVELRPSLPLLFLTVLVVGLVLGGRAAAATGLSKMYAGALTTFLILFGAGVSPLPTTASESFSTRIGFVLCAIAYAVCLTSLLWLRERPASGPPSPIRA